MQLQLQVIAQKRRLEIQGEPWLDDTESFYMALVEVKSDDDIDSSEEITTPKQRAQAQQLSDTLPALVNEWKQAVLTAAPCHSHHSLIERFGSQP